MESEANAPGVGISVFNHPPRPRATPTVVAAHAPVQALATMPAATMPDAERRMLEDQRRRGGQWFYWIAGLSLINAVLAFSGQGWRFILGLGITQVVQELAEQSGGAGVKAGIVGLAMIAFFTALGQRAVLGNQWAFVLGMVLFGLDGCIFVLAWDWIGVAFHGFALAMIWKGYMAARRLPAKNA
jgi:hypothetical protein